MAISPYSGASAVCTVGATPYTLPGTNWRLSVDAKVKDTSNFRDGRLKTETLHDANFTIDIIWDTAAEPNVTAGGGLVPGASMTVNFQVGSSKNFTGTFIIATVEPENPGLEDVVMYHVTGELIGSLTFPT